LSLVGFDLFCPQTCYCLIIAFNTTCCMTSKGTTRLVSNYYILGQETTMQPFTVFKLLSIRDMTS